MANLYNKAGLVNIPVGYQDGFLYNIKPTDNTLGFRFNRNSAATRVNKEGLIEEVLSDKPRIDYTDSLTSPSFLLEPQRTNEITYSEDISTYINFGSTDDINVAISPDGSQNASSFEGNGAYNQALLASPSMTLASAGSHTISVFAKKGTNNFMQLFADGFTGASNTEAYFDLENGTTPTSGANIEDYGSGWYRCSTTVTIDSGDLTGRISVRITPSTSGSFWSPNSANVGKSVFVYGFQMEAGSYATSYIPTDGSTVTRVQETCVGAGNASTFNDSEGVLYAEIAALANDGTKRRIAISDGTNDNRIVLGYFTDNSIQSFGSVITSQFNLFDTSSNINLFNKCAIKYKQNDFALWVNGVEVATDTSGNTPTGLNQISIDDGAGADNFYGNVKAVAVFKEALTDDELQQLTGPEYNSFAALAAAYNYTVI